MPGLAEIVRLRPADCRQAAGWLPALAGGEDGVDARCAAHVAACLRCQAELASYRRVLRHLRRLRDDEAPSPPGALAAVLAALEGAAVAESTDRAVRRACVGGITVVTAAAGVLVWLSRRRPGLPQPA